MPFQQVSGNNAGMNVQQGGWDQSGANMNVQQQQQQSTAFAGSSGFSSSFQEANTNRQSVSQSGTAQSFPGSSGVQHNSDVAIQSVSKVNEPFKEDQTGGSSRFFENIIIIQYDANIQEVWDVAKALRCEWHDNYHKTVSYKPFQVDSLEVVPATFAGDNVGVWMTVQQGMRK